MADPYPHPPCESHNIWADFPGSNGWKCVRCGYTERQLEVRGLEQWLPSADKKEGPAFFGLDRSAPSNFFNRTMPKETWVTRLRRRISDLVRPNEG